MPHGEAQVLSLAESKAYEHIGITIDFSGNDQKVIQTALKQGGKSALYTFIHVVETAAAQYHGDEVLDQETLSDEANITKYKDQLLEMGYKAEVKIGFGNTAKAILKTSENYDSSMHLNIGTGSDLTIKELAGKVASAAGFTGEIDWDTSKPDGTPQKVLDVSKIKALGWEPTITLEAGIASTIAWYKEASARGEVRK